MNRGPNYCCDSYCSNSSKERSLLGAFGISFTVVQYREESRTTRLPLTFMCRGGHA